MTLLERLRSHIFWLVDIQNGGKVRRHFSDVSSIMTCQDATRVEDYVNKRISRILEHAHFSTAYYKEFNPSDGIKSFPLINKNIIRENSPHFLSDKFPHKKLFPATTSGSTGTPFRTFQNKDKKRRNSADTLYFAKLGGYELGNKLYYLKIWSKNNKKSSLIQKVQNIVPVDVLNLKKNSGDIISALNQNSSSISILGYVSAIETLCNELDTCRSLSPSLKVNSIITMSETLNEYTKLAGEKYFSSPVLSRYSNIENGIIAQQTLDSPNEFVINKASYFVEIFHLENDVVVENGTLGRIIVTDYFNEAMPFIRYDTGDLGVVENRIINGVEQQVLSRIEGRKLDQIYNTKGELISSYIVYKNMWKYPEIEQYQFIQKAPTRYLFKVSMKGQFFREEQLIMEFKQYLGADADFQIEYAEEIPLLNSGKRKKVMNEMNYQTRPCTG